MTASPADLKFADEAGDRFEQAFALCSFASELVGKATE
jgi:hypothetical protein